MVNPVFKLIAHYLALLNKAFEEDPSSKAVFVVPDRPD